MSKATQQHPLSGKVSNAAGQRHSNRDGVTLVSVLVSLGLIAALLLGAFQSSLKQRRQLDRELQMEQTRWLATAAIAHGKALADGKDVSEVQPIILKPKLSGDLQSNVRIEFEQGDFKGYYHTTIKAQAWIGNEDRPEQNTIYDVKRLLISPVTPQ